jgi:hypothetical protein
MQPKCKTKITDEKEKPSLIVLMKSLLQILMLKSIHRTVRIKTNSNFTKTKSETDKLEFLTTNPIVSPRLKS